MYLEKTVTKYSQQSAFFNYILGKNDILRCTLAKLRLYDAKNAVKDMSETHLTSLLLWVKTLRPEWDCWQMGNVFHTRGV
jgi:hypothetical protein